MKTLGRKEKKKKKKKVFLISVHGISKKCFVQMVAGEGLIKY